MKCTLAHVHIGTLAHEHDTLELETEHSAKNSEGEEGVWEERRCGGGDIPHIAGILGSWLHLRAA